MLSMSDERLLRTQEALPPSGIGGENSIVSRWEPAVLLPVRRPHGEYSLEQIVFPLKW
jgi:hypothetical protein